MAPPPRDAVSRPAGEEFPMRSTSAMSNEENQSMVWSQPNWKYNRRTIIPNKTYENVMTFELLTND